MPGQPGEKSTQFARIAARIREEITAGQWPLGERLPGEVELARRYGVSRGTVVRALTVLREERVIITVHGQGSVIACVPVIETVAVGPADVVLARTPEEHERQALGMAPGVPLLVVRRAGGAVELYDAAVTVISGQ